jgi:hypothetical protein
VTALAAQGSLTSKNKVRCDLPALKPWEKRGNKSHQMPNWRAVAAGLQAQAVSLDHSQRNTLCQDYQKRQLVKAQCSHDKIITRLSFSSGDIISTQIKLSLGFLLGCKNPYPLYNPNLSCPHSDC